MDIAGEVVAGTSQILKKGDLIVAPGVVGNSDRCSFQTHVLVDENHCAKVSSLHARILAHNTSCTGRVRGGSSTVS